MILLRVPRTAPLSEFCFADIVQSRSTADELITTRKDLFVSMLINVWIVVGFSNHILATHKTCFLRMITGFLLGDNHCFEY